MAPIQPRAPGAPSDAAVRLTRASATEGAVGTSQRYIWTLPIDKSTATNEFPIVPTRHDGYDDVANIKSQFAEGPKAGSNWMVPFTGEDAAYEMRKRDDQENALFEQWVMQQFDITDPAESRMLQEIAPELYRRREEVIDSQQALVSRYAKLRLRGVRTLEDLRLQWLIETDRLTLPKGPIWDPFEWRMKQFNNVAADRGIDESANRKRYRAGMFSPLQWVTTEGWKKNKNNRADIYGDPTRPIHGYIPAPDEAWANVYGGNPVMYPYTPGNTLSGALPVTDAAYSRTNNQALVAAAQLR